MNLEESIHNQRDISIQLQQEGHDGPEVAHLYIGPQSGASLNLRAFFFNKLGRHPFEDVSC
jgi:hypothetical protein